MSDKVKPYTLEELEADMREYGAADETRIHPTVEALAASEARLRLYEKAEPLDGDRLVDGRRYFEMKKRLEQRLAASEAEVGRLRAMADCGGPWLCSKHQTPDESCAMCYPLNAYRRRAEAAEAHAEAMAKALEADGDQTTIEQAAALTAYRSWAPSDALKEENRLLRAKLQSVLDSFGP